jgi:hypothetical protein
MADHEERETLMDFFETVSAMSNLDCAVSDFKIIKDTQRNLKKALRDSEYRCTCAKRTWGGPCEVCQASDRELVELRNFFRVMRKAKQHDMTKVELQEFVENTKKHLSS